MSGLSRETLDRMFNDEVRVSTIIHVQGALIDCESPTEQMKDFLEDVAGDVADQFEPKWPGYTQMLAALQKSYDKERKEDRRGARAMWLAELGDYFLRACPAQMLVAIEYTLSSCINANPEGECLGTWRAGWGYYTTRWHLVDSVEEAIELGLSEQRARKVAAWTEQLQKQQKTKKAGGK